MTLRLPRLQAQLKIVDDKGNPNLAFMQWWQKVAEALETTSDANDELDTNQSELIEDVAEALSLAQDAIAALEAQAAMERTRDSSATGLTLTPGATDVVISGHTRHYLEPTESVSVTGNTISGLAAATTYYVHYTDPDYAGGAVGYQTSLTYEGAVASLVEPYRHFVGIAVTGGAGTPTPEPYWKLGLS